MEQDIEKENERLRDLLYSKIMFIEQLKEDYRTLVKDIKEIIKNYNEARDLAIKLRKENERLKAEFRIESLTDKTTGETIYRSNLVNKYRMTLQEIMVIAEEWMTDYCCLDNFYDKEGCCICHENKDCYSYRLLKAITKAEEE